MRELIRRAARQTGTSEGAVEDAIRILVGYLDDACDGGSMRELRAAVPELAALAPAVPRKQGLFSGMFSSHTGLLALPGKLSRVGFGPGEVKTFLPMILDWLRGQVDEVLWERIESQLPRAVTGRG